MLFNLKNKMQASFAEGGILSRVMAVIVVIYPVCALFSKRANDALFWLLVVLSIGIIFCRKNNHYSFSRFLRDYWPLWLAMSLFFLAELSNQLFATRLRFSLLFSEPFRFALLPLLVYGWLALPLARLKQARWGWALCAVAGGIFLFFISGMGKFRPETANYTGIYLIPFSNFSILAGFMAVFAMGWGRAGRKNRVIFGAVIFCSVIVGLYASKTRASWIVFLILLVIAGGFFWKEHKKIIAAISGVILLCIALGFFFTSADKWLGRFQLVQSDIAQYQAGDANTSIGARLQLWEASWMIFTERPWTGIGGRKQLFQENMARTGINFAHEAAIQVHTHNEFLQRAVRYGILGGAAVIAVFLVPFIYFVSYIRSPDSVLRTTAFMGAVYNLAFFLFGLSDVIFEWRTTVHLYIVVFSVLLAILMKQKEAVLHQS